MKKEYAIIQRFFQEDKKNARFFGEKIVSSKGNVIFQTEMLPWNISNSIDIERIATLQVLDFLGENGWDIVSFFSVGGPYIVCKPILTNEGF